MRTPGLVVRTLLASLIVVAAGEYSCRTADAQPARPPAVRPLAVSASSPYDMLPQAIRKAIDAPFTGDFDAMIARGTIRVGVTFNRTHYFIERGQQRGLAYELLTEFESTLNARRTATHLGVRLLFVPMQRDLLLPALVSGRVDAVAAMLTVTPEREALVAFSEPTRVNVNEVVVTGPGGPAITTVDDLSGREVFVRKTSSYYSSLVNLNRRLKASGKREVAIVPAPEVLEDDDLLEMVNAGLATITIVDDYLCEFWRRVFTHLNVHRDVAVRSGGNLAVAVRKANPQLLEVLNAWIRRHPQGSLFRSVVERRYLWNVGYLTAAAAEPDRGRFLAIVGLFEKYGAKYGVDALLMVAQGYQESRLNQRMRSRNGAIGVMQVMPRTARELGVGDVTELEANIHAGVKYNRRMMDDHFARERMDQLNKELMTFAAYNAGPGRVQQIRHEATVMGLDPDVWFANVERVALERVGHETVQYVGNIFKYYVAYTLSAEQLRRRDAVKATLR